MRVAFVSSETVYHRDTETNQRLQTVLDLLAAREETNQRLQTVLDLLAARDHDVHCVCAKFWDEDRSRLEREGVTYHGIAADPDARYTILSKLPFVLAAARPDVVHASAASPTDVLAAGWGATLARAPLFVEWYGDGGIGDDRSTRLAARRADWITTPSELVSTWVQERGADGDVVERIPNPIDLDRIRSVDPGESVDVIYARRLDEAANLESLLLGLAELRRRDWTATVVGDGPERGAYERLASDLRIDDRVTFAGDRSLEDRIAAYRGAHVFAQTADHCVFPTEMLRALAAGCVGIVEYHAESSAHELVEGWNRGFRTTSERELADAIRSAGALERRDYDETFADYDRDVVVDRYLDRYRALQDEYGLF